MQTWTAGDVEITRVDDPDFELVLPQDEPTMAVLSSSPWLQPHFVTDDWALRVGSSCTVLRTPAGTALVDPFLAFDDPALLGPRLSALRAAGVGTDDVDVVLLSHVDGVGACVLADGSPTFPRARYLMPRHELDDTIAGSHPDGRAAALVPLHEAGSLDAVGDGDAPLPGLRVEEAPGHSRGHVVVWAGHEGDEAVVTGHLFLHPAQIAAPEVDNGDVDPAVLAATRRALLERCSADGVLLIGPLFAPPGAGHVRPEGSTWRLDTV